MTKEIVKNLGGGQNNKQSIGKLQDNKLVIIAAIIIVLQIIAAILVGFQKREYHIDEIYSYNFSNSAEAEKFSRADWLIGKWVDGAEFDEIVTVQEGERFNYEAPYRNTSLDAHPPLYYWALHTVCSLFPDSFSIWLGVGLNLLFFIISEIFIFLISKELINTEMFKLLPMLLYGFSFYAIDTIIFARMYMLLTMFTMIFVYQNLKLMKGEITIRRLIPLCITIYLGAMTQYYFLVFAFWGCLIFIGYLLKNRRYKEMIGYAVGALLSVVLMFVSFPYVIEHVTGSETNNIGNEVTRSLFDFKLWIIQLYNLIKTLIYRISSIQMISIVIVVFFVGFVVILMLKARREKVSPMQYLKKRELTWIFTAFVFTVITIAKIGGDYVYLRYIYFIIPLMYVCVIEVIDCLIAHYKKLQLLIMSLAICFAVTNCIVGIMTKSSEYLQIRTAEETKKVTEYKDTDLIVIVSERGGTAELTGNFTKIREFDSVYVNELDAVRSEQILTNSVEENGECVVYIPTDTYWIKGYHAESVLKELIGAKEWSYSKISNGSLGEYYLVK